MHIWVLTAYAIQTCMNISEPNYRILFSVTGERVQSYEQRLLCRQVWRPNIICSCQLEIRAIAALLTLESYSGQLYDGVTLQSHWSRCISVCAVKSISARCFYIFLQPNILLEEIKRIFQWSGLDLSNINQEGKSTFDQFQKDV